MKSAVNAGANAVYLGLDRFNARAKADNFTKETFGKVVSFCHLRGVKVYVTVNILVKENELADVLSDVNFIIQNGADAIIIQDLGILSVIHSCVPDFPLHVSTQAGICNLEGARYAKSLGATRVVLARETPLSEVKRIKDNLDLELEYFVQGALCVCYSGNCYMSSIVGGNSGNRGKCAQMCRKRVTLSVNEKRIEGYNLSPADLNYSSIVPKLSELGIDSFKIEGRLRSPEYVFSSVSIYRKLIDGEQPSKKNENELKISFNRGDYSLGYTVDRRSQIIYNKVQSNIGLKVGVVEKVLNGKCVVKLTNDKNCFPPISFGDGFKATRKGLEVGGGSVNKDCEISSNKFELSAKNLKVGDEIHLTMSTALNKEAKNYVLKMPVEISYEMGEGKQIFLEAHSIKDNVSVNKISDEVCEKATKHALTKQDIAEQLSKTGELPFEIMKVEGKLDGEIFLAKSVLNKIRRELLNDLANEIESAHDKKYDGIVKFEKQKTQLEEWRKIAVVVNENNLDALELIDFDIAIFSPTNYRCNSNAFEEKAKGKEKFLRAYNFMTKRDQEVFEKMLDNGRFEGIYVDGYNGVELARKRSLKVFFSPNSNISNSCQIQELAHDYFALSKELNLNEIKKLKEFSPFVLAMGDFATMTFVHCPLINAKICDCKTCVFDKVSYVDEENREFKLSKSKLDGCVFTLQNILPMNAVKELDGFNQIYDFSSQSMEQAKALLSFETLTSKGHITRGIK